MIMKNEKGKRITDEEKRMERWRYDFEELSNTGIQKEKEERKNEYMLMNMKVREGKRITDEEKII